MKDITKPCAKCNSIAWNKRQQCRICINSYMRTKRSLQNKALVNKNRRAYRADNQSKIAAQEKAWRENNPDRYKSIQLRKIYSISIEEYNRMFEKQNGCCAICKQPEVTIRNGKVIPLSVDHDHSCCSNKLFVWQMHKSITLPEM